MKKNSYNLFIIFFFLALIFPVATFAYEKTTINVTPQNDFVVEPGKTEIFLNPGDTVTKNISITSRIDRTVQFKLTTEDLVGSDNPEQTVILLGDESGPYSLKNFIHPEISEFSLSLGEKITIPVTISVPQDAEPRGYYGALIISNQPDKIEGGNGTEVEGKTRVISRIGSLFLVKINGEGREEGSLQDFKLIGPTKTLYESRPAGFEIAFQNSGNVHLVPYGKIVIENMLGKTVAQLPVDAYFVLPDSTRYREVLWGEGVGFGRYTATLSLYRGYGNEHDTVTIGFWILPWKILAGSFIGLLVIVSIAYYLLTRFEIKRK